MMDYHKYIGQSFEVVIDRPLGSKHPEHGFEYPVNYGYVPDTQAGDGEEVDVYVLGVTEPVNRISGVCIAVIHRNDDNEDKLVLTPDGCIMDEEEIMRLVRFQEQHFDSVLEFQNSSAGQGGVPDALTGAGDL
jgi:inorganic pyrophosphatase